MYFGVDYYPEHWPQERWEEDARLMAEANFNVVRLAEFAWSKIEPKEGTFDFEWLDHTIEILTVHDIKIILGTPTASPPPWLMAKQEDLFRVDQDGRRLTYGNRREYCPNHPLYHDHTRRIVTAMVEHYRDHSSIIGWQIDNEFGDRCYCAICRKAFQDWLCDRYGSLEELNSRWGTLFWSHVYTDWSEIPTPLKTGGSPNPGLALDFYRFASDSYVAYQKLQIDLLREICPSHFITHNFMGFNYDQLDYFDLARDLDFVAWDIYWRMQWNIDAEVSPSWPALGHDTMRGLKEKYFWVMEQQAGPGGWEWVSAPTKPGELRLWAYQSIAHGADAILFFRWRTALYGTEEYWHGVLDHHGRPGRRYEEIQRMGAEIQQIGDSIQGAQIKAPVAFLLSYDSRFAFQIQGNNPRFSYPEHFHDLYRAFHARQIPIDILSPTSDLSSYPLVIAPALHIVNDEIVKNLETYVRNGGTLMLTIRTGVKDEANAVVNQPLPGLLADLCGVEVEEYVSLPRDLDNEIQFSESVISTTRFATKAWCDVLQPMGAKVLARYRQDYFAGKPAITMNEVGEGKVVYLGTMGEASLYGTIAAWLLDQLQIGTSWTVQRDLEIGERWQGDRKILFLLNHSDKAQRIPLEGNYRDLLDGSVIAESMMKIPPREVVILEKE